MPETVVLLLCLEGSLQAWGSSSRWVIRGTDDTPTLSGVVGLVCAALGLSRTSPLDEFSGLTMAVRVDREGTLVRDYHTVGAGIGCMTPKREIKRTEETGGIETLESNRYYLADASFLVALAAPSDRIESWAKALQHPVWPLYLGRKSCAPSVPMFEDMVSLDRTTPKTEQGAAEALLSLLKKRPWRPRLPHDEMPSALRFQVPAARGGPRAFPRADVPLSFSPRRFEVRYVREIFIPKHQIAREEPLFEAVTNASNYVNYRSSKWLRKSKNARRDAAFLCCFCGLPAEAVHHVTYEHAGDERPEDLRAMCHLCHDAVTMLDAERGMWLDRIRPEDPAWGNLIAETRERLLKERLKRDYRKGRLEDVLRVISGA